MHVRAILLLINPNLFISIEYLKVSPENELAHVERDLVVGTQVCIFAKFFVAREFHERIKLIFILTRILTSGFIIDVCLVNKES